MGNEWTGIRQNPEIREWSSNAAADEAFARYITAKTAEQRNVALVQLEKVQKLTLPKRTD